MCNSNKQSTTSEYSGIVPLSLIIKKYYKTFVPFLELINDIIFYNWSWGDFVRVRLGSSSFIICFIIILCFHNC